jgi:hypothetical protein
VSGNPSGSNPGAVPGGTGTGQTGSGPGDEDPWADPARAGVYDPFDFGRGTEERVDFQASDPSGQGVGLTDPSGGIQNVPVIPYTTRIGDYSRTALETLESLSIPNSLRDVVRGYFTELGG